MPKQSIGIYQKQNQTLSPLQIQTIKLIELPIQELEQKVRTELEENPILDANPNSESEETKQVSIDELQQDESIPKYKLTNSIRNINDKKPEYDVLSTKESSFQNLYHQLGFLSLSEKQKNIAAFIVGSLNKHGYLKRDLDSLVDDLACYAGIYCELEDVERMLKVVQSLEPAGIGARDLRECLLLQLKAQKNTEEKALAIRVIEDYFDEFVGKHNNKIMQSLGISKEMMRSVIKHIRRLNPYPGALLGDSYAEVAEQIVPDFVLGEEDGKLCFTMPRFNIPELRINKRYSSMLEKSRSASEKQQKEAATYVKEKLNSAKWFIEALKQRQNTLNKTMQAIIDFQYPFFESGDETKLKPMILDDIAKITGFDISTISRVVNSKYIETPYKIYSLKYFFSEALINKAGEEISTRELKTVLQQIIDQEDKQKPLTDEQLVSVLSDKGYKVARRTIAKYRDQLRIPLARHRREL